MARKYELNHTVKPLYSSGPKDAPILVVCDVPGKKPFDAKQVMGVSAMKVFAKQAEANGFKKDDFAFVIPASPMPAEVKDSDSRQKLFLEAYHESFSKLVIEHSPKLVVVMGKNAGRAFLEKAVKITKLRGQITKKQGWHTPVMGFLSPTNILSRPELADTFNSDFLLLAKIRDAQWNTKVLDEAKSGENYTWVKDLSFWLENRPKSLFVDTEFKNLRWYSNEHEGICIQATDEVGKAVIIPMGTTYVQKHSLDYSSRTISKLKRQFKELMEDPSIAKAGFNFKIDMHVLENVGIKVRNWYVDAQMLAFAVDENMMTKSQSECVRRWVPSMAGYSDQFDSETDKEHMMDVPIGPMTKYSGGDVDSGYRLTKTLMQLVRKDKRQWNVLQKVQMPALRCFQQAEREGFEIDEPELANLQTELKTKEEEDYKEIIQMIPASIKRKHLNMESQKNKSDVKEILSFNRAEFLLDILFSEDGLDLDPIVYTKTTKNLPDDQKIPSTSAKDHLPYFTDEHEIVQKIINYKKLSKMATTYVGKRFDSKKNGPSGFWKYLLASSDGKIHPSFHLHRTVTGRTASSDPNAQNYPKRGDLAKAFRKIFKAVDGHSLIEVDLSQAEIRIAAWMANERAMLEVYRQGGDIHSATAAKLLGVTLEAFNIGKADTTPLIEVYKQWRGSGDYLKTFSDKNRRAVTVSEFVNFKRYQAKAVNFGFLYGMGWRKFKTYAKTDYGIEFTDRQAEEARNIFFEGYKDLPRWHNNMREFAREHGYVRSLHGAIRHLPNIFSNEDYIKGESERQAINSPVQRFASDIGLMGMSRFGRDIDWNFAKPIAFIHDAVVVRAPTEYADEVAGNLRWYMETPPLKEWFNLESPVPILADASVGPSMGEMEERPDIEAICPDWYQGHEESVFQSAQYI